MIPLLFLNSSLGGALLPLTIEFQDFTNAVAAADNCGEQLLKKWYTLDEKSQPSCYRLKSVKIEKENLAQIDEELNSLLLSLVEVFSKELRDSYLTTVVEQEVNNTVFMSQELSKRCIWMQNTGLQKTDGDQSLSTLEAEIQRRLNHVQDELKVRILHSFYNVKIIFFFTFSHGLQRTTSSKCRSSRSSSKINSPVFSKPHFRRKSKRSSKNTAESSKFRSARSASIVGFYTKSKKLTGTLRFLTRTAPTLASSIKSKVICLAKPLHL